VGAIVAYNTIFSRYNRPDYNITPGLINYEEISETYNRTEVSFKSNNETLQGYYYKNDEAKALVVMSHGANDGADSLLSSSLYFLNNGYSVFSYDNTGCFSSTGRVNGFSQSLIDLENALYFLNEDTNYKNYKKLLFGYSLGGYASTAIFNLDVKNVYGSVSISGFNDASNLIFNKGKSYVGPLAYLGKPIINTIQSKRFKEYNNYTALSGINKVDTPIYLIHGLNDTTIRYKNDSISILKDDIINKNVLYHIEENKDHVSILYSDEANEYRNEIDTNLSKIKKYDEKAEFVKNVDDYKYSKLNMKLYQSIISFYDNGRR
jgi:predicted alpha/beta-fold hydrolase